MFFFLYCILSKIFLHLTTYIFHASSILNKKGDKISEIANKRTAVCRCTVGVFQTHMVPRGLYFLLVSAITQQGKLNFYAEELQWFWSTLSGLWVTDWFSSEHTFWNFHIQIAFLLLNIDPVIDVAKNLRHDTHVVWWRPVSHWTAGCLSAKYKINITLTSNSQTRAKSLDYIH